MLTGENNYGSWEVSCSFWGATEANDFYYSIFIDGKEELDCLHCRIMEETYISLVCWDDRWHLCMDGSGVFLRTWRIYRPGDYLHILADRLIIVLWNMKTIYTSWSIMMLSRIQKVYLFHILCIVTLLNEYYSYIHNNGIKNT